jgi:GNAT superfamily N-acetyltransferase
MVIRPAEPADLSVIIDLIRQLAEYEKLSDEVSLNETEFAAHLFGEHAVAEVLLAEDAGRVLGFALTFTNFSTFVGKPGTYLEDLFVVPEARGRGLGKALLLAVVRRARERGHGRVEWSVLNWNTPAIEFYESLGAKPMNEWTVYRLTEADIHRLG